MSDKSENLKLMPWRVVVQLNRIAPSFVDKKGAIALRYFNAEYSITWLTVADVPIPSLSEMVKIENEKKKRNLYVGFDKFIYEANEIKADDLQYLGNEVFRSVREIDQNILSAELYNRWGIRFWYKVEGLTTRDFILGALFRNDLNSSNEVRQKLMIQALHLQYISPNAEQGFTNAFQITSGTMYQGEDDIKADNNDLFIDVDISKTNIRGLSSLQDTVQKAVNSAESSIKQFMNEVFQ